MKPIPATSGADAAASVPKCILVVEDELLIRLMLSDGFRDLGYHVIEAWNADEALVLLSASTPDLIISDVRMPGSLDGMGLLAVVRKSQPLLPVIITSGHLQGTQAMTDGATSFLAKPFTFEVILEAVQKELAKS